MLPSWSVLASVKVQDRPVQLELNAATGLTFGMGGLTVTGFETDVWSPSSSVTVRVTV